MKGRARKNRTGAVLICVMACLFIATTIAATTLQTALRERRETRLSLQMRQTELLLDAGVMRAARQLRESVEYRGEKWRPVALLPRFESVLVEIDVTENQDKTASQVEVIARIGAWRQNLSQTQRSHTFSFDHPPASKAEKLPCP